LESQTPHASASNQISKKLKTNPKEKGVELNLL